MDSLEFLKKSNEKFGLIFTSPPYGGTENYCIESDSMGDDWLDSFIIPITKEFSIHLVDGGCVALHLKDITGAPTLTAYHMAMVHAGFKLVNEHIYKSGISSQKIRIYKLDGRSTV
jgi:DNA modification methylase